MVSKLGIQTGEHFLTLLIAIRVCEGEKDFLVIVLKSVFEMDPNPGFILVL